MKPAADPQRGRLEKQSEGQPKQAWTSRECSPLLWKLACWLLPRDSGCWGSLHGWLNNKAKCVLGGLSESVEQIGLWRRTEVNQSITLKFTVSVFMCVPHLCNIIVRWAMLLIFYLGKKEKRGEKPKLFLFAFRSWFFWTQTDLHT